MGKAVPAPRSQGQPGTSVRVTLHIWVLSPAPWPRAGLSVLRRDMREPLSGKGGQVGAWVRAPRAVTALPPANIRQPHAGWGGGQGPADQAIVDPARHPAAEVAGSEDGGWDVERGWAATLTAAPGTPSPHVGGGLWHTCQHPDSGVPPKVPCCFLLPEGKKVNGVWAPRAHKKLYPPGEAGQPPRGGIVVRVSRAQCPAWHLDSPVLTGAQAPEAGRASPSQPPHLLPGEQPVPSPQAGAGGAGVQVKATGGAGRKQGQGGAGASRAAGRSSGLGISPHSSVLQVPHGPHPAHDWAQCDLLSLGLRRCSAAGSSLVLGNGEEKGALQGRGRAKRCPRRDT